MVRPRTYHQQSAIQAVGGVVYRVNKAGHIDVLLIKKRAGYCRSLPKGKMKAGETRETAVLREVSEETGMTGHVETFVQQVDYMVLSKQQLHPKIVTYYLMRATQGRIRPEKREGIEKIRWFALAEALRRLHRERHCLVVRRAGRLIEARGEPAKHDPSKD